MSQAAHAVVGTVTDNPAPSVCDPLPLNAFSAAYHRDGFVSGVPVLTPDEVCSHRRSLEAAEDRIGAMHYRAKAHTILCAAWQAASHPRVLDMVSALIGPDVLLYNVTYIIKEAGTPTFISWHQDLTYWGLSHDDQVTMWLALSPADESSGCMRMVPGSHLGGRREHQVESDSSNALYQGQTVAGVSEADAVMCPLRPGEASFHHGWTLHASTPNRGSERRIGLNVQYLAPHVRQTKHDRDTAMLVRGEDRYGYYGADRAARVDLHPDDLAHQAYLEDLQRRTAGDNTASVAV